MREGYTALRCLEPSCAWDAPQALQRGSRRQLSGLQAACAALAAGAVAVSSLRRPWLLK